VMYGVLGFVVMQVVARMDLRAVRDFTPALLGLSFVLLLAVKVPGIGVQVNGATRWLGAGPVQFQPSELMKLALVLYAVRLLTDKPRLVLTLKGLISPLGYVVAASLLLIASQPDLGTALVIGFTMVAILVAAGMPMRLLARCIGSAVLLVGLFALVEPYRRDRLIS